MLPPNRVTDKIGFALIRIIVPLWVLTGAAFKLVSGDPRTLPQHTFVEPARDLGIGLGGLLYTLIGLELLAVGVMILLARLARPMALFMLTAFIVILLNEMRMGADACGCFGGTIPVKPWQMLIADGVLLAGVLLFRPRLPEGSMSIGRAVPIAALLAVAGLGVSFGAAAVLHKQTEQQRIVNDTEDDDPTINPSPRTLPSQWWTTNLDDWIGRPWQEIDLFQMMPRWPKGMDEGTRYVIFYSRTCSACQVMFEEDLLFYPPDAPLTAVEIPDGPRRLRSPDAWPLAHEDFPEIEFLELPLHPHWIIQSPLAVRIEDGLVACVQEGEHKECLDMP
jgi:hypothetical protein